MSRTRYTGNPPMVSIPDMRPSGRNPYYEENISMPYGNPLAGLPLRKPSVAEDDDSYLRAAEPIATAAVPPHVAHLDIDHRWQVAGLSRREVERPVIGCDCAHNNDPLPAAINPLL